MKIGGHGLLTLAITTALQGSVSAFLPKPIEYLSIQRLPTMLNGSMKTYSSTSLTHVDGIKDISNSYSTFLLDMWGVMHDGTNPYEGVIDTVKKLKENGKKLIILSNSSKRKEKSIKALKRLGFDPEEDFDQIITSGEVSYRMLSGDTSLQCSNWKVLSDLISSNKKQVFVFGSGDGDEEYCSSCGWTLASIEDADLILARGTFTINDGSGNIVSKANNEKEYFDALNKALEIAAARKVPMLVSNPDKVRPDKGLPPMPGAIGDSYEELLDGDCSIVKRIGKPYPEVYELALQGINDPSDVIMVGDALVSFQFFRCSKFLTKND
jgi:HAD superfamily hydrolase (TIGR01459 family)